MNKIEFKQFLQNTKYKRQYTRKTQSEKNRYKNISEFKK